MKLQEKNSLMVGVYDDVIPLKVCEGLINLFENSVENHEYFDNDHKPCFTQLNINTIHPELVRDLVSYVKVAYGKYSVDVKNKYLPELKVLEEFRLKRYNTSGDERFDEHIDVIDYSTARRSLAFLYYLNDNDGNTVFPLQNLNVEPKCGRVVVFSPTWQYPHSGLPPTNNNKYILSTYLHYGSN